MSKLLLNYNSYIFLCFFHRKILRKSNAMVFSRNQAFFMHELVLITNIHFCKM